MFERAPSPVTGGWLLERSYDQENEQVLGYCPDKEVVHVPKSP
jgi:hypothetical protein